MTIRSIRGWVWVGLAIGWFPALGADLDEARALARRGSYGEVLEIIEKLPPGDPEIALLKAECQEATGQYTEAISTLDVALAESKDSVALLSASASLQRELGKYTESLVLADRALAVQPDSLAALWERVLSLDALGRHDEIMPELEKFIDFYNDKQPSDPQTLLLVAKGAAEFARRAKSPEEFDFILNTVLADARESDPEYWPTDALAGEILLEKYNKGEAIPLLNAALKINPSAVPVLVQLGMSAMRDFDFANGFSFAKQALEVNPHSAAAHCVNADLYVMDERVDEALASIGRALETNPVSEEALGRQAACYYLKRENDKAEALEKEVLARNPRPGIFYARCGELLEQRRQFGQAEKSLRRAIEVSDHLSQPRNDLGMLYMRIGREAEAEAVFQEAFDRDPFHVRISNMKKVLKHLEDYEILRSEHYELKVSGDQDHLLGPYMLEYLEQVHRSLCDRFGYEPPGLTKIEIMKSHQWFSARVVGLPSIGTVGACTGDVVALASPQGLPQSYNWARVLIHEVTHVITLQQTHYNIPHWYTEALAVMSEGYPRSQTWNELLAERVPKRDLLNLDTINHAFGRPKTPLDWQMAYCQAQLYAEYMLERFGPDSLSKLLAAYRDGMPTEVAIRAVFGVEKPDFERGYLAYLDKVVGGIKGSGSTRKEMSFAEAERAYQADPDNPDLAADLAVHYMKRNKNKRARELADQALAKVAEHPTALYVLAKMEWSIGKIPDALKILEPAIAKAQADLTLIDLLAAIRVEQKDFAEAAKLYQTANERDPYNAKWTEGLVSMYMKLGEKEKLPAALEKLALMDADNSTVRQKLAELAAEREDWASAARWARESMHVTIKPEGPHRILARAAKETKDWPTAIRELEVLGKLAPKWEDAVELARVYALAGQMDKAKEQIARLAEFNTPPEEIAKVKQEIEGT